MQEHLKNIQNLPQNTFYTIRYVAFIGTLTTMSRRAAMQAVVDLDGVVFMTAPFLFITMGCKPVLTCC